MKWILILALVIFSSVYPAPKSKLCNYRAVMVFKLYRNGKVVYRKELDGDWWQTQHSGGFYIDGKTYFNPDSSTISIIYKEIK